MLELDLDLVQMNVHTKFGDPKSPMSELIQALVLMNVHTKFGDPRSILSRVTNVLCGNASVHRPTDRQSHM